MRCCCWLSVVLQSQALATQLSQYRSTAAAKISSLAGRATLDQDARQELEELTAVLQAALAQVDVLSRQAALAEVLQHRIADQEDVLQQLQTELEHVDAQRVSSGGISSRAWVAWAFFVCLLLDDCSPLWLCNQLCNRRLHSCVVHSDCNSQSQVLAAMAEVLQHNG